MEEEMVTISKQLYEDLLTSERWLTALEDAGVDNWGGIEFALELFNGCEEEE